MIYLNLEREIIDTIAEICKKYDYVDKVAIFGSRARGDNSEKSDIDLAVYSEEPILEFIEDVEMNTRTLLEYDFAHINTVKDELFLEQVKRDGIVIYEKCRF